MLKNGGKKLPKKMMKIEEKNCQNNNENHEGKILAQKMMKNR